MHYAWKGRGDSAQHIHSGNEWRFLGWRWHWSTSSLDCFACGGLCWNNNCYKQYVWSLWVLNYNLVCLGYYSNSLRIMDLRAGILLQYGWIVARTLRNFKFVLVGFLLVSIYVLHLVPFLYWHLWSLVFFEFNSFNYTEDFVCICLQWILKRESGSVCTSD